MNYRSIKVGLSLIAVIGSLALAGMAQQTSNLASLTTSSTNSAVVPPVVNYSGVLADVNGKPPTGAVGVTFTLYQDSEGGTPLWMEVQNVQPAKSGHYTVMLGSTSSTGLPQDVFITGQARWLGARAEGQAEQPRVLLVAVPYALKAGDAETIGGLPSSAFMLANGASGSAGAAKPATAVVSSGASKNSTPPANPVVTGTGTVGYIPMWDTASDIIDSSIFQKGSEIGIGTTAPAARLDVSGKTDVRDTLTLFPKSTDNTLAVSGSTFNISSLGKVTFITGQTFPGAGTITGVTTASGSGLSGGGTTGTLSLNVPAAGITNAMLADSKITLNASTAGGLTVPGAMTLGSTYTIGLKTCSSNQVLQYNGTAWACASVGTGTVTNVGSGAGLTGGPITGTGSLSVATAGVSNAMLANPSLTISPGAALTGGGSVALGGSTTLSLDTTKVPLLAAANTFSNNQTVVGTLSVLGQGFSTSGSFVNGSATDPTLYGDNIAPQAGGEVFEGFVANVDASAIIGDPGCNTGFIALQLGQSGMSGCNNYTLAGGNNGQTYINSVTGGAVYLRINSVDVLEATSGNVSITGTLNATGTKNFRIDHPLDPANKYLFHASIESSEVLNLYSGNVVLDATGEAVVQLPDWFEAINKDLRYQLTNVGGFAPVYVAEEVSGGHFKIAGGKPGGKVSWQVSGVRNDAWEKAHPMVVEADKGAARGQYLTPELYGAPETARIGYMAPAPGSEQIVHQRPAIQKRGNASPLQRTPPSIPVPPKPVAPKIAQLPHPAAPASKLKVNQE